MITHDYITAPARMVYIRYANDPNPLNRRANELFLIRFLLLFDSCVTRIRAVMTLRRYTVTVINNCFHVFIKRDRLTINYHAYIIINYCRLVYIIQMHNMVINYYQATDYTNTIDVYY